MAETVTKLTPTEGHYYALDERVSSLSNQVGSLQRDMHDIRSVMASSADVVALTSKIDGLAKDFTDKARPQWQVMFTAAGVITTLVMAIGGLAYLPISQNMADLKSLVTDQRVVFRPELQQRWLLTDERTEQLYSRVNRLENRVFTMEGEGFTPRDSGF